MLYVGEGGWHNSFIWEMFGVVGILAPLQSPNHLVVVHQPLVLLHGVDKFAWCLSWYNHHPSMPFISLEGWLGVILEMQPLMLMVGHYEVHVVCNSAAL